MCIGRPGGPKHSSFWQRGWGAPDGVQVGHSVCWFSVPPCVAPHGRLSDPRVGRTHENTISAMSPACSHAKGWHQLQRPPGCLRRATHLALAPALQPGHQQPELLLQHSQAAKGSPFGIASSCLPLSPGPVAPAPACKGWGLPRKWGQ